MKSRTHSLKKNLHSPLKVREESFFPACITMPFYIKRAGTLTHARAHTHTYTFEALIINAKCYCAHKSKDGPLNKIKISVISDI